MNIRITTFLFTVFFCCTAGFIFAEEDVIRDIILINRVAELVDVTKDGEVLQRHVVIKDYFTSGRSHKRSLRQSLNKLKVFGNLSPVEEKEIVYTTPVECRQSLMRRAYSEDSKINEPTITARITMNNSLENVTKDGIGSNVGNTGFYGFDSALSAIDLHSSDKLRQLLTASDRSIDIERVLVTSLKTSKAKIDV